MFKSKRYKEWFEFSAGEQRGVIVLLACIVLLILVKISINWFSTPKAYDARLSEELWEWIERNEGDSLNQETVSINSERENEEPSQFFHFNPNLIGDADWLKLGLNPRQIKSIRNYLLKGGSFKVKKDMAKMYTLTSEDFDKLYPYIDLPEVAASASSASERKDQTAAVSESAEISKTNFRGSDYSRSHDFKLDINTADTSEWKQLRGIGPWLAKKIVDYRERLGGFHEVNQLLEIYRMTPEKLDTIRGHLLVDPDAIRIIHINTVSLDELQKHPYLSRSQSTGFISYRGKHGLFNKIEDIRKCLLIDDKTFEKLKFYLTVD